ncbi:archease [Methanobrevibacter filiformis]|uniref:Protein archease n=1 Tax=Methanobrevibacter filiformis TaxID=55758 RepID=A0A166E2G5_9EURY|nr:archease [Methanobrevibacter filiformis]KZX16205.1 protein archease [Methanobrevibacter filiformis]
MQKNIKEIIKNENNVDYEFFDVTADIGIYAYGNTLESSFENAGKAMFDVITNINTVQPKEYKEIAIESEDLTSLLYDWLEELLIIHEVQFLLLSKFEICSINFDDGNYYLKAKVYGENINWNHHERGSEVKAITFHMMEVVEENNKYKLRVILDL